MRYPAIVEILPDGQICHAPKRPENEGDLLLLDQAPGLLDGLGRTVTIVKADQVEAAAIHAARFVDHLEVSRFRPADDAVGRRRATVGHALANLDFTDGDARRVG